MCSHCVLDSVFTLSVRQCVHTLCYTVTVCLHCQLDSVVIEDVTHAT